MTLTLWMEVSQNKFKSFIFVFYKQKIIFSDGNTKNTKNYFQSRLRLNFYARDRIVTTQLYENSGE